MKFYSNRTQETINQSIFQIQWWTQQGVNKKVATKQRSVCYRPGVLSDDTLSLWLVEARGSANIAKRSYLLVTRMPSRTQRWARDGFKGDEDPRR